MNLKKYSFLLVVMMIALLLAGCSVKETAQKLEQAEDAVEQRLDQAEDAVEDVVRPDNNGVETKVSSEEAIAIALEHAGLTAEQVTGLRAELEMDDGVTYFDVQFRQDKWEYEYEIHSDTGEILSAEKDD